MIPDGSWRPALCRALIAVVVTVLAGCATTTVARGSGTPPADSSSGTATATPRAAASDGTVAQPPAADALPNNTLDAQTLYQLMIAEIAAQRGMPDAAFVAEYNLARETRDPRIARRATEFALMARQQGAALQGARLWVELSPNSDEANGTLLTMLIVAGRLDEAEPILRHAIARAPNKPAAFGQVAATLARAPNHAEALVVLTHLAGDYPQLAEAHLALAQIAQAAQDPDRASAEAHRAIELAPSSESAAILAAQYLQGAHPQDAEKILTDFLKREPKSFDVGMAYARFLIGQRRYDDASHEFEALLKERPRDAGTLYTLGLLAYQAQHPAQAENYFKRFLSVAEPQRAQNGGSDASEDDSDENPSAEVSGGRSTAGAYLYLAQIAEDRKDDASALADLAHISDGPEFVTAQIRRAFIIAKQGKIDDARAGLKDVPVRNLQDRIQITLADAQILRDANRSAEALTVLNHALEQTPNQPELLYDLGMTAEKLDRLDLMESSLRTLIRLQPENAQAYNALGYTFADRNIRLDEAHELIAKAISLAPDDASIIDSLGWVEYRQGDAARAIEHLERAYKLRGDAEIAVHLGEVLWVSGRHAEAEKYWAEAQHKEPENDVLRATLARFNVKLGKR